MRFRNCLILFLFATFVIAMQSVSAQSPSTQPSMEAWWSDLEKNEPDASRALLNFSSHPTETIAFFKRNLRPLVVDPEIIQALLTQLGSDKEAEWKAAFADLQYFDPRLAIDLPTLMDQVKESPTRQRLVEILSDRPPGSLAGQKIEFRKVGREVNWYNFYTPDSSGHGGVSWGADGNISHLGNGFWNTKTSWIRAIRAIVLLEHIGTPDAVAIIKSMDAGNPEAQPTKVAQDALAHLAKR